MTNIPHTYREMTISSAQMEVPREAYQRNFNVNRAKKIADEFDERIANEPKVSFRDGRYFVFDGQHTVAARKFLNGGEDLPIKCKVYFDMTEQQEALLFAQQTGASAPLSAGAKLRAEIHGEDPFALAFKAATESVGLQLDYDQERGEMRIGCIQTARNAYATIGEDRYKEATQILATVWNGDPDSFRAENVVAITRFVDLYHEEYNPKRLIEQLRKVDPLAIYRAGQATGLALAGYKKYLYQVWQLYNGGSKKYALPLKF